MSLFGAVFQATPPKYHELVAKYLVWCGEHHITPHPVASAEFEEDFRDWLSLGLHNEEKPAPPTENRRIA
jgi:hypothetical protein